jgi:hypothetical protein
MENAPRSNETSAERKAALSFDRMVKDLMDQ